MRLTLSSHPKTPLGGGVTVGPETRGKLLRYMWPNYVITIHNLFTLRYLPITSRESDICRAQ